MKAITINDMYSLDNKTIEIAGIPSKELMKRAGEGAAELILDFISNLYKSHKQRFVILAGVGNNGGDAFVVADYLYKNTNIDIIIYSMKGVDELKNNSLYYAKKAATNIKIMSFTDLQFRRGDIIIDGLLGIGQKGALRKPYQDCIEKLNGAELPVVAIDIPSGLNANDGSVFNIAVKADLTITMGYPKIGMILNDGPKYCGIIKCVDIGIPEDLAEDISSQVEIFFENEIKFLTRRSYDSYKYSHGRLLIIAGSLRYPGAALLTAEAACKSGVGLVVLAVPESADIPMPTTKSIVFYRIPDAGEGLFDCKSIETLNDLIGKSDAIVIGPGLTTEDSVVDMLEGLNFQNKQSLWDADALNIFSNYSNRIQIPNNAVLTPHYGEFVRMLLACNLPEMQKFKNVGKLAQILDCIIVLKGHNTVSASFDGRVCINSSGTPALATAGTGDVLAGFIGGLLAQGIEAFEASCSGVFIHGAASENSNIGYRALNADDLLTFIPIVLRKISPFA